MECKFCGAKRQDKNQRFCEFCGARFPMQQIPPRQSMPTYSRAQNIGSTISDSDTYTTTETFGRGTKTCPNQRVDKSAIGFVVFLCIMPLIIGSIITFITASVGNGGGLARKDSGTSQNPQLSAEVLSITTARNIRDVQHNIYDVNFAGSLKNTCNSTIVTAVITFDLYYKNSNNTMTYYETVYAVVYDLYPRETRAFNKTMHTYKKEQPTEYNVRSVNCYNTLYYPTRCDVTKWDFTLSTNPQSQATYSVGVRNQSSTTISWVTLHIKLYSYGIEVGSFTITITDIEPGQERKIELGTRNFTQTGVIDENTSITLDRIELAS